MKILAAGTRAAAAALAGAAVLPSPHAADAHPSDPTIVTRIDAVEPPLPNVTVEVRDGVAAQLLVVNATATPVEVTATGGEPFLRIGPATVEANVGSPDWYTSNAPFGTTAPTRTPTRWRVVAKGSAWGWFDHRLHPRTRPLTPELRNARQRVRLADWTVPLRYQGTTHTVRGHVEYRPVVGAFHTTVEHAPPNLTADALDGRVPGLFLHWSGSGAITIRGIANEPFARLTPQGTEVNDASETWQESERLSGRPPTAPADPTNARWRRVGTTPQLTWLDRRLAYAPGVPPDDVARARKRATMVEWDVPVDGAGHLTGTTTWVPTAAGGPRSSTSRVPYAAALAAVIAAVAAVAMLRRRAAKPGHREVTTT
ncbi:MAG: hypothetical protein QOE45_3417 [Frankiaceae bacterium]|jgi:hypothetical protein|nr:hypothetical protein [Frankiaceae bacterium]